jgi:hypothetical protein
VTFSSSTAAENATGFDLETDVFANGADTQANNCVGWSNTDRGFYLGGLRSLSLVARQSGKQLEYAWKVQITRLLAPTSLPLDNKLILLLARQDAL